MKTITFIIFSMLTAIICPAQMEMGFRGCMLSSGQYNAKTKTNTITFKDTSSIIIDENLHGKLMYLGKLTAEGNFSIRCADNLILDGKWKEYYPDGKIRSSGNYHRGQPVGLWSYYYPNGHLRQQYTITAIADTNGNIDYFTAGTYLTFFENSNIEKEGQYSVGYYMGTDSFQQENPETGEITLKVETKKRFRSKPFGTWIYYNADGTVKRREENVE